MDVRSLGPEDREALSIFACAGTAPWSREIEEVIRGELAEAITRRDVEGAGLYVGDRLVAVSVWTTSSVMRVSSLAHDPTRWRSTTIAVTYGHRGNGYARMMKSRLIEVARASGAKSLTSFVHEDNAAMIAVNTSLGGRFTRDPTLNDYRPSPYLIFDFRL